MICRACGKLNEDGIRFCVYCGEGFADDSSSKFSSSLDSPADSAVLATPTLPDFVDDSFRASNASAAGNVNSFEERPRRDQGDWQGTAGTASPEKLAQYREYLVGNIVAVVCCCMSPIAVVGLVFSFLTRSAKNRLDERKAFIYSTVASACFWISLVLGLISLGFFALSSSKGSIEESLQKAVELRLEEEGLEIAYKGATGLEPTTTLTAEEGEAILELVKEEFETLMSGIILDRAITLAEEEEAAERAANGENADAEADAVDPDADATTADPEEAVEPTAP